MNRTSRGAADAGGYPTRAPARSAWILERRGPRNPVDPVRPNAVFLEEERTERGDLAPVLTILLANRECPWRCVMCDLWKDTTVESVPAGAIPRQIRAALERFPAAARRVKLYNAGSFFDPRAIPPEDFEEIAALLEPFERVVVESHPALVGESCRRFRALLTPALEVAMGLETIHPAVLPRLNKRMTTADFAAAAARLSADGVGLRAFVLVGLPFVDPEETVEWAVRSAEFAFDAGAGVVSLVATRGGNGALDALAARGEFVAPPLSALEQSADGGLRLGRGRVFADLWDAGRLSGCHRCRRAREGRLRELNRTQASPPPVLCGGCGTAGGG